MYHGTDQNREQKTDKRQVNPGAGDTQQPDAAVRCKPEASVAKVCSKSLL